ncbi:hypothetical protein [Nonomuraea ceibae]|uniref:hypothetical protein n=1 Tax=Nonomuraea ceibae TaxID=1935170 RepID=UPI001C5FE6F0|nr:hypothetical protein [Nonomuraea ceibae]
MARGKFAPRRRPGPDFGSVLVMVAVVGLAWLLLGWSPVGFGLTLACVVIVLTAVEAVVFPRRRRPTARLTRREARRADRRGARR